MDREIWIESNDIVCNTLMLRCNQEIEINQLNTGILIWVKDHYKNKEIALILVERIPIGDQALDLDLGYGSCILSSTLLWNMEEKQDGGLDDMNIVFSFLQQHNILNTVSAYSKS